LTPQLALLCGLLCRLCGPASSLGNMQNNTRLTMASFFDYKQASAFEILKFASQWSHFACHEHDEDLGEDKLQRRRRARMDDGEKDPHGDRATVVAQLAHDRNETLNLWTRLSTHFDFMLDDDSIQVRKNQEWRIDALIRGDLDDFFADKVSTYHLHVSAGGDQGGQVPAVHLRQRHLLGAQGRGIVTTSDYG
jgi:hypothetical protein